MLSFLAWAARKYDLDLNRVFTAGNSMGASGSVMFAIRHAKRIAWAASWVGVHDPGHTPGFQGSYERVFGKKEWQIRFEDESPVFDYYKDAAYVRKYPAKDIGFITWSNTQGNHIIQKGNVTADRWGFVTFKQVKVSKGGNRIIVTQP